MGKNPSFPFYPSDWTRDLDDQDLEIEGAWIRIICRLWWADTKGEMTKTLKEWSRILRKTEQKTLKIFQILIKKRLADGSVLDNQNITIINRRMKRYDEICQLRKNVGKLGGNPVLLKPQINLDNQNDNQNRLPSSSSSSSSSNIKTPIIPLPDWIDKNDWISFKEHRNKLRKPMTERAEKLIWNKIEKLMTKGHTPTDLINTAIERGWQTVFEPHGGNGDGKHKWSSTGNHTKLESEKPTPGKYDGIGTTINIDAK